ncbi:2-amino-4-hydroxy-6-hydroxymethyldihydropteridine diphosphokinase [Pasteurellaceae bacterium USgator11]|nr:2-amino-4-hydroxy-6-hydroxymethyldihydropteridine diphosphokinase [Pasteurellaceae bacterium UScroc12]TNG94490.1 2-amino-4-hydroxy-6-hydroxymethyldihydropteridine diphosphokinase [Pasteurellaceae bacterium USgator41]TNG97379.1 2-amino-4-hydroxy-6-hydroxymethyldihydropteridine diphosphokinase [Pasteurellaceae bacterium UScroc31]TNH00883.1 2-amino-4-hydroxy-6-hydroxymethyldihydropteridine diphosphokinase [Pasteurellaceae bacterium USgator11]
MQNNTIPKSAVYIALGSNLDNPTAQLQSAVRALDALPNTQVTAVSAFYRSKPLGPQDQPDFINAVAAIETALLPLDLLDHLQHIEQQQGRVRLRRWGERTLDLDILLYGDLVIESERLSVPHYDMANREFVIVPLYEIAPRLRLPNGEKLTGLADKFKSHHMEIIRGC